MSNAVISVEELTARNRHGPINDIPPRWVKGRMKDRNYTALVEVPQSTVDDRHAHQHLGVGLWWQR